MGKFNIRNSGALYGRSAGGVVCVNLKKGHRLHDHCGSVYIDIYSSLFLMMALYI